MLCWITKDAAAAAAAFNRVLTDYGEYTSFYLLYLLGTHSIQPTK
jgi:hypothetical protein